MEIVIFTKKFDSKRNVYSHPYHGHKTTEIHHRLEMKPAGKKRAPY